MTDEERRADDGGQSRSRQSEPEDSDAAAAARRREERAVPDAAFRQLHQAVRGEAPTAERRRALLTVVCEVVGVDTAFLTSVDPNRDRWRVVDAVGPRRIVEIGAGASLEETFCRHTVEDGEFCLADARTARDDPGYWQLGAGSYLGTTVETGDRTVGTLCVAGAGPRGPFGDDERTLLRAAADLLGANPQVAGTTAPTPGDGERPRPVGVPASWFDGGMLSVGTDRRVTAVDERAADILDARPEALVGKSLSAALGDAEDRRAELAVREAVAEDRPVTFERDYRDRWLWAGVYPTVEGVHVYLRTATERREHEQVLERVTDGFLSLDRDLSFTYVNSRAADLLGCDPDEVVHSSLSVVDDSGVGAGGRAGTTDLGSALIDAVHRAVTECVSVDFEAGDHTDGWVHGRVFPDEDGVSVYLRDVTERRRRERVLDELLDRTRELMRAESRSAVAEVVSGSVEEALGFERAEVLLHEEERDMLVPPDVADEPAPVPTTGAVYRSGEGLVGEAFAEGEPRVENETEALETAVGRETSSLLVVPLGRHGVVTAERTTEEHIDESDVSLVSLLAETAIAALDRARRRERLSMYERLLEAGRDKVYAVDDGGRLTFVSPALADRLGYDPGDLVGEHHTAVLVDDGVTDVADAVRRLAGEEREDAGSVAIETEAIAADDSRIPVEVDVSVVPGEDGPAGVVGVVREIADLKAVREELSRERTRFSRLFENLPDPALEMEVREDAVTEGEPRSTLRTVNPALERAFEVEADAVVGEPLSAALGSGTVDDGGDPGPVDRVERAVREREPVSFQLRQQTSEGVRDFVFQSIPYRETEDRVYAFGIYTDITEQRDRERRLEVLNRVLRHNMRTQLNVVDGYAEFLAEELGGIDDPDGSGEPVTVDVDPDAVTAAEEVRTAAGRVLDLADEARHTLEMLEGNAEEGPVDVADLAEDVVEEYAQEFPAASIALDHPEEEATAVDAGGDVRLALAQIVENAIVHNDDDPTVQVSVRHTDDGVVTSVTDDGPGVPEYERAVVTGDREPTQLEHGSGLGLWMVRWVVEGHGGTVAFKNRAEPGDQSAGGTTVELWLPSV